MSFEYEIDVDRRLLIATARGDVTLADAEDLVVRLSLDARHSPGLNRVFDCRAVTRLPPTRELRAVADLFRRTADPTAQVGRAIVVRRGAPYAIAVVLQALLELAGLRLEVFSELDEALEWAVAPAPRRWSAVSLAG